MTDDWSEHFCCGCRLLLWEKLFFWYNIYRGHVSINVATLFKRFMFEKNPSDQWLQLHGSTVDQGMCCVWSGNAFARGSVRSEMRKHFRCDEKNTPGKPATSCFFSWKLGGWRYVIFHFLSLSWKWWCNNRKGLHHPFLTAGQFFASRFTHLSFRASRSPKGTGQPWNRNRAKRRRAKRATLNGREGRVENEFND